MEHYEQVNPHRVHLGDGLGLKRSGRTSQIMLDSDELTHDGGIHQSKRGGHPLFPPLLTSAPLCCVLMDSAGNPCGTDYTVEGSRFDRPQISTKARLCSNSKSRDLSKSTRTHFVLGLKVLCQEQSYKQPDMWFW